MSDKFANHTDRDDYLKEVKKIVGEIKYGNVNLIIQDGRVIQIDRTEKIRINKI